MRQHLDLNISVQLLNLEIFLPDKSTNPGSLHILQAPQMQADILSCPLGPPLSSTTTGVEALSHILLSHGTDALS